MHHQTFEDFLAEIAPAVPGGAVQPSGLGQLGSQAHGQAADPVSPQQQMQDQLGEMRVKAMVKRRLGQFFDELGRYNLDRGRSIRLLTLILQEFSAEMNLGQAQQRTALRTAIQNQSADTQNAAQG